LNDFQIELQQDLDLRESLRGEGHVVSTDEEFFGKRLPEQTQIQKELAEASEAVRRLKQLCLDAGIYVESPFDDGDEEAFSDSQSEVFSTPLDLEQPTNELHPPALSTSYGSISPGGSLISRFLNTRDRVKKWLIDEATDEQTLVVPTNDNLSNEPPWVKLTPSPQSPIDVLQDFEQALQPPDTPRDVQMHPSHSAPHRRASPSETSGRRPRVRAYSSA
jgi:hypothetical protein